MGSGFGEAPAWLQGLDASLKLFSLPLARARSFVLCARGFVAGATYPLARYVSGQSGVGGGGLGEETVLSRGETLL
jgi:hypothetical protein